MIDLQFILKGRSTTQVDCLLWMIKQKADFLHFFIILKENSHLNVDSSRCSLFWRRRLALEQANNQRFYGHVERVLEPLKLPIL